MMIKEYGTSKSIWTSETVETAVSIKSFFSSKPAYTIMNSTARMAPNIPAKKKK